ncbi:peptidyl-prolyl cis-trans isomerase [Fimbriimonas ginsengisoli]|nr:peptidyl-prolyl cis-trans isomerase [Fimbriimonas ginsengisoli]
MFYTWSMNHNNSGNGSNRVSKVALQVAGNPVEDRLLADAISQQAKGAISEGGDPALSEIEATRAAFNSLLDSAAQSGLVQKLGIKTDDATLLADLKKKLEDDILNERLQLMGRGQLKPNATDADFEKVLGRPLAQIRADADKRNKEMVSTPEGRRTAVLTLAPTLLTDYYKNVTKPTDQEVKDSYNQYQFKRVLVQPPLANKPSIDDRIKAAQADIAKNVPFEQVIDKYSDEHPFTGKKARDTTIPMLQSELSMNPAYKPLLGLKPGQVSPVITVPEGKAIYKLLSVKSNLPNDFEKNKERYRQTYVATAASQKQMADLAEYKKTPGLIVFKSPPLKAFYDFMQATDNSAAADGKSEVDRVRAAYDEAVQAEAKSDGFNTRPAVLARYAASNYLWGAPGSDKAKLRPERIDTLQAVLQDSESFQARKDLFDLYMEEKKYDEAFGQLLEAAKNNTSYDRAGFQRFNDVRDMLSRLQKANGIKPEQVKQVEAAQLDWSRARAENDKMMEEQRKEQAKAAAEQQALEAKDKAEMAKAMKAAEKTKGGKAPAGKPGASTTPGTTPAPGSSVKSGGITATIVPPKTGAPKK